MRNCVRILFVIALGGCASARAADSPIEAEAWAGAPFGVGWIRVATPSVRPASQPFDVTFDVEASGGRVFYPAFSRESLPGAEDPDSVTARSAWFLFTGEEPLELKFHDGQKTTKHTIPVATNPEGHERLKQNWWSQYCLAARASDFPLVENYTTLMLARRLNLKAPSTKNASWNRDEMLGTLLGFEELRLAMQSDRMLDSGDKPETADLPLPDAVLPPAITVPEHGDVEIEPLASHVPEECFYLRFGSYSNYRWFRDTASTWGGNLRDITSTRSVDYEITPRLEKQLVLKDSELGRILGDSAISDMAVIGTDSFVREGSSLGVLFREKQPGLLAGAIQAQRVAARQSKDVTEQSVEMLGRKVSLLTSPGNVVRSYYVVDGEFHFVTNSSTLARRFLEAGQGTRPLSDLEEFRYARTKHPSAGSDAILGYLSDPFIRQLVSPAYRVEMTRRMKAEADVELVSLARLAAISEGAPHASVDELVAGGFLPDKFGKRPDDTLPLLMNGQVVDSLRGARRTFLPVADVLVAGVTRSEADAYQKFSASYQALYRRMDPVSFSLGRSPAGEGRERIVLDLSITPFTRRNLGALADWLRPAEKQHVQTPPEVLAFLEVGGKDSRMFAGLLDGPVPFYLHRGRVAYSQSIQDRPPFFLGENGRGMIRQFLGRADDKPGTDGYFSRKISRNGFDLTEGRQWDDWWVINRDADVLQAVTPHLQLADAERPAQLRFRIGDLGASRAAPALRAQQYCVERKASAGNARLLDAFTQQLHASDETAMDAAASVLGAKPVCPLGGQYTRVPPNYQFSTHQPWYSTAWPVENEMFGRGPFFERLSLARLHEVPADYHPHLIEWAKGLLVEVQFSGDTMLSHIELEVRAEK